MKTIIRLSASALALLLCLVVVFSAGAVEYEYEGLYYTVVNNYSVSVTNWDGRSSDLIIPDSINGRDVISIGNGAISGHAELNSVDFSECNNLNRIGMAAFSGCGINQELVIPKCVTTINTSAFQSCASLPSVVINADVTEIPDQCFYNCSSLSTVTLNDNLQRIGYYAFANCTALERVNIPRSVNEIGKSSFQNDDNLTLGVWYDSYGYRYAKKYNIPYVLLDNVKLGDANGDGYVNINDVTTIQRHLAEITELEGIYYHVADVDQNGELSIFDATDIQMFLAEYDVPYPIGEVMTQ